MDVRLGLPRIDGELQPARGEVRRRTGGSCIADCEFAARGAAHCGLAPAPPPDAQGSSGGHHPDVPYRDRADPRHQAVSGLAVSMTWKDHSWEWLATGARDSPPW